MQRGIALAALAALAAVCAAASTGCTNGKSLPPTVHHARTNRYDEQEVHVLVKSFYFEPSEIHVKAGTLVQLALRCDTHFIGHRFALRIPEDGLEFDKKLRPGARTGVAFVPKTPGTYTFDCPDHRGRGMKGVLVVEPAEAPAPAPARTPDAVDDR